MEYLGVTVGDKSKQFAIRIIKFSKFLNEEKGNNYSDVDINNKNNEE